MIWTAALFVIVTTICAILIARKTKKRLKQFAILASIAGIVQLISYIFRSIEQGTGNILMGEQALALHAMAIILLSIGFVILYRDVRIACK